MTYHLSAYCEEAISHVLPEPGGRARTVCGRLAPLAQVVQPPHGDQLVDCAHCLAVFKAGRRASQAIRVHGCSDPTAIYAAAEWFAAVVAARALVLDSSATLAEHRAQIVPPRRVPG